MYFSSEFLNVSMTGVRMRNSVAVRKQLNSYLLTSQLENYSWKSWCWTKVLKEQRYYSAHLWNISMLFGSWSVLGFNSCDIVWFPYLFFDQLENFFLHVINWVFLWQISLAKDRSLKELVWTERQQLTEQQPTVIRTWYLYI